MSSILKLRTLLGAGVGAVYEFFAAYEAFCFISLYYSLTDCSENILLSAVVICMQIENFKCCIIY